MLGKIPSVPLVLSGYCPYLPSIHPPQECLRQCLIEYALFGLTDLPLVTLVLCEDAPSALSGS